MSTTNTTCIENSEGGAIDDLHEDEDDDALEPLVHNLLCRPQDEERLGRLLAKPLLPLPSPTLPSLPPEATHVDPVPFNSFHQLFLNFFAVFI